MAHRTSLLQFFQVCALLWIAFELHGINREVDGSSSHIVGYINQVAVKLHDIKDELETLQQSVNSVASALAFRR